MGNKKVYKALSEARLKISKAPIMKQGKTGAMTTKAGKSIPAREYLSLKDITPVIVDACAEAGLTTRFEMDAEFIRLDVISTEDDSVIEFKVASNLPGHNVDMGNGGSMMHPIQKLGSSITYMRRYMNLLAFDIVENDNVEGSEAIEPSNEPTPEQIEAERRAIEANNLKAALKHFTAEAKKFAETNMMPDYKQVAVMHNITASSTFEQVNEAITKLEQMNNMQAAMAEQAPEPVKAEQVQGGGFSEPTF